MATARMKKILKWNALESDETKAKNQFDEQDIWHGRFVRFSFGESDRAAARPR